MVKISRIHAQLPRLLSLGFFLVLVSICGLFTAQPTVAQHVPIPSPRSQKEAKNVVESDSPKIDHCEFGTVSQFVEYQMLENIDDGNGCAISEPILLETIDEGVAIEPPAILNCNTARTFVDWYFKTVKPAAKLVYPDRRISKVLTGSSYACRNRNNGANTKLSEHATGNAIDISAIEFDADTSHRIRLRNGEGSTEEVFQKAIRFGACLHFDTVLGPGSDRFHSDHLHLDKAARSGGYRLCKFPEALVSDVKQ